MNDNETSNTDTSEQDSSPEDPRQLILPHVNTSPDVSNGYSPVKITPAAAMLAIPAVLVILGGVFFIATNSMVLGVGLFAGGILFGGMAVLASMMSGWSMYPHEHVLSACNHARRRCSMPWGYSTALAKAGNIHGNTQSVTIDTGDGTGHGTFAGVLKNDGRVVVPIRLQGGNTEYLEPGEVQTMAASLTQAIDGEYTEVGDPISVYSTSRPVASNAAEEYQQRARNHARNRLTPLLSGMTGIIGEWVEEEDRKEGANDMQHYIIVSAKEHPSRGSGRAEQIENRISEAMNAIGRTTYLDGEPLSPREATNLACEYWSRGTYPEGEVGESAANAAVQPASIDELEYRPSGTTPFQRATTPTWYSEKSKHVEVGDTVARTFWISSWPEQPQARFLQNIYSMRGVDLDVKIYAHPKPRAKTTSKMEKLIARIDSEGMERAENMSAETLTIGDDLDAYALCYKLLQSVNVRPWGLSGFVTVRASDVKTLNDACESVEKEMRQPPARATPTATFSEQDRTFRSAAPFGTDQYTGLGDKKHRAEKTHLALGGIFGAIMPASTPTREDPGGFRWGRDVTTGRMMQVDPFSQGGAPHLITIAPSGGGKTFSAKQVTEEWWQNGDDRTIIAADTGGEFENWIEGYDGEHLVIDGKTGINPLDIRPAADHEIAATGGDQNQLRLAIESAADFFCGIIRGNGVDPSEHRATIEHAIEQTYAQAGITPDPDTHSKEAPEPLDLFDTFGDMMRNPLEYTHTDEGAEAEGLRERVKSILNELSGFQEGGKYHHLLEETTDGISPDTDVAYIDMRQLAGQDGAHSVNLQLAVGQVSQLIKQTEGETVFLIDEAHNLLHSPEMVNWLNKAAREWRAHDAALWMVTQSPQEFVRRATGTGAGAENKRESILEQCSTIQLMNCGNVDPETLAELGLPAPHARVAKKQLVPGNADGMDYSECLLSFRDERGWIRTEVKANPVHAASIDFMHRSGWSYEQTMLNALQQQMDTDTTTATTPMGDDQYTVGADGTLNLDLGPETPNTDMAADGGETE